MKAHSANRRFRSPYKVGRRYSCKHSNIKTSFQLQIFYKFDISISNPSQGKLSPRISKMRCAELTFLGLVLPIASASIQPDYGAQTVTLQLTNDQSGANINQAFPADGKKYAVKNYWGNSALARGGGIYASSAQISAFQQGTFCIIEVSHVDVQLDARNTWTFLAGGELIDLSDASLSCRNS